MSLCPMGLWQWSEAIAPVPPEARITLGEGGTPLVRSRVLGPRAGLPGLHFKLENLCPTGSYKDRFACVAVADMVAQGRTRCLATSSGNTGAALAGYCAAAGIPCHVALVEGAPLEKCRQMLAYGAQLHRIEGFGKRTEVTQQVWGLLQRLGSEPGAALQISCFKISPVGMTGVQTIALELAGQAPHRLTMSSVPPGGRGRLWRWPAAFAGSRPGGNWRGFRGSRWCSLGGMTPLRPPCARSGRAVARWCARPASVGCRCPT